MTPNNGAPASSPAISSTLRAAFYALMIGVALLEVFVTFRGLRSPAGMEQAQLARELARGNGWTTKCVRPAAWKQMLETKPGTAPDALPDTANAPLPALLLAPLFKMAQSWWEFDPAAHGAVYVMDRIVAAAGALAFLLMIYHLHGLACALFDEKVAVVAAAAAGFCDPLWELAVSGSPRILLGLGLVVALRLVCAVLERHEKGAPILPPVIALGLTLAAMTMTHGLGLLWAVLILGWLVAALPRAGIKLTLLLAAPLLLALGLWLARNLALTGDLLGASKLTLRASFSTLGGEMMDRNFTDVTAAAGLPQILRLVILRLVEQWREIYGHLGMLLPACLFPLALAHRFRRRECRLMLGLLAALLVVSMVAMAFIGPVTELAGEHNVLIVLAPPLAIFGAALAAMLWARWHPGGRSFGQRWGYALALVGVTAFPLFAALPDSLRAGLMLRGQLSQWPPYAADRVAVVGRLLEDDEVLLADAPWFTAWYTDKPSIWMPAKRVDFQALKVEVEAAGRRVAGMVVTPVSAQTKYLGQIFDGSWGDWPDLVFRGPVLAFDREMRTWPDFPYPVAMPLAGFSIGQTEGFGLLMAFYTDRQRTVREKP